MAEFVRLPDRAMATLRLRDANARNLPKPGGAVLMGSDWIVAVGPDEWLAIAGDGDAASLIERLRPQGGTAIDVSGNRVLYRVAGPDARWFLAAGCSVDFDALAPGNAVSTLLARAQVILIVVANDSILVAPRRSFAPYLESWAASVDG